MSSKKNSIYISHGGGPLPLLGDPDHQEMVSTLKTLAAHIGEPSAILVISAHWEAQRPTLTSGLSPELIYDYHGFPKESYDIEYPCSGEPELAEQVYDALSKNGIDAAQDAQRGFDHGLFIPLKIMYPKANIPCMQLSLVNTLDPKEHLKIGRALRDLDWHNLLVVGSGFSFHNMRAFFSPNSDEARAKNIAFDDWLRETVGDKSLSENLREQRLQQWHTAPAARFCHPREEHLMPLHVCYGFAGKSSDSVYQAEIMKQQASMFLWEC